FTTDIGEAVGKGSPHPSVEGFGPGAIGGQTVANHFFAKPWTTSGQRKPPTSCESRTVGGFTEWQLVLLQQQIQSVLRLAYLTPTLPPIFDPREEFLNPPFCPILALATRAASATIL